MTVEPIVVSYSELDTFRQCPLKHHLGYGMRYTRPVKEGSALHKGSLYHSVMQAHYLAIKAYQDAHKGRAVPFSKEAEFINDTFQNTILPMLWNDQVGAFRSDTHALICWMYEGYVQQYGADCEWKIIAIEHQIVTPLRDAKGRKSRYHLKAKIDLLIQKRDDGTLWVIDHKSGGNLPTKMDLEIDDQFGLYCWAFREVGRHVTGSIHSANRTQRNISFMPLESRMSRTYLNRSENELTNLALDAYHAARAAYPPKGQQKSIYSSPNPRSCGWMCDFKEPHLVMRQGRKMESVMMEFGFKIDRTRH